MWNSAFFIFKTLVSGPTGLNKMLAVGQTIGWTEFEPRTLTLMLESCLKAPHASMSEAEHVLLISVPVFE